MQNKKVLLAMSGGVDSSACAILLKNQGYDVTGVTLNMIKENDVAISDAKKVCEKLGINHVVIEAGELFKNKVIDNFVDTYKNIETPNPCIQCNIFLKFGILYDYMISNCYDYIATGHYAKVVFNEALQQNVIVKSKSEKKDQTYVLYGIEKEKLNHIIFPLADFESKDEIREVLKQENLEIISAKKDSQEICFVKDNDFGKFLEEAAGLKGKRGKVVDKSGNVLGEHKGLIYYTIGQRRGLGIASTQPLFIVELDKEKNQIVLGEEKDLYKTELIAKNFNFQVDFDKVLKMDNVTAKVRYASKPAKVKIEKVDVSKGTVLFDTVGKGDGSDFHFLPNGGVPDEQNSSDRYRIVFDEPQKAITRGQSVVLYNGDILLGGGIIC